MSEQLKIENWKLKIEDGRLAGTPHAPRPTAHAARRGLTLMELLVVVSILVILTVFALPVITPSTEVRRIREAARSMNVFLGAARNRAMEKNRPVGVLVQRRQGLNQASTTLFQAEVPLPYAGDTLDAKVRLTCTGAAGGRAFFSAAPVQSGTLSYPLIKVGDRMQVGNQGPMYEVIGPDSNNDLVLDAVPVQLALDVSTGQRLAWYDGSAAPPASPPLSFQFFRQPVPTMAVPLSLPATIAIDTRWSGVGIAGDAETFKPASDADSFPIIVMFSPKGEVDAVYCRNSAGVWRAWKCTEPLYFMVGKQNRVYMNMASAVPGQPSPAEDQKPNYRDTGNLWVTVNAQTGLVKTVEVAQDYPNPDTTTYVSSRRIAVTGQSMGGK